MVQAGNLITQTRNHMEQVRSTKRSDQAENHIRNNLNQIKKNNQETLLK
jgi:hypothetical protein